MSVQKTTLNKTFTNEKTLMHKQPQNAIALEKLYTHHGACTPCLLKLENKHSFVRGIGNPHAHLMLIGEAPGKNEDEQGMPFVGKSGMLLTKALNCLGVDRKDVFITNCVKCRPPQNRKPTPQETKLYKDILIKEIEIIQPKVICTLGSTALESLMEEPVKITALLGKELLFHHTLLIPTYHPAYLLRNPQKFESWLADLCKALRLSE